MAVNEWLLRGEARTLLWQRGPRKIAAAAAFYGVTATQMDVARQGIRHKVSFSVKGSLRNITAFADWARLACDLYGKEPLDLIGVYPGPPQNRPPAR